jgi:K+-transporting ATPase A subunit
MTWQGWLQIALFVALITALVKPLGGYFARVAEGTSRIQRLVAARDRHLSHRRS